MILKQPPGAIRLADGTYTENPAAENRENLPKGYYTNLITGKTDEYIRVYVMCEYGRSRGGKPVHPMFNKDVHVAKASLIPNKQCLLLVAADFGRTPAMVLKQQDAFGRVLTFDSIATFGMSIERAIECAVGRQSPRFLALADGPGDGVAVELDFARADEVHSSSQDRDFDGEQRSRFASHARNNTQIAAFVNTQLSAYNEKALTPGQDGARNAVAKPAVRAPARGPTPPRWCVPPTSLAPAALETPPARRTRS